MKKPRTQKPGGPVLEKQRRARAAREAVADAVLNLRSPEPLPIIPVDDKGIVVRSEQEAFIRSYRTPDDRLGEASEAHVTAEISAMHAKHKSDAQADQRAAADRKHRKEIARFRRYKELDMLRPPLNERNIAAEMTAMDEQEATGTDARSHYGRKNENLKIARALIKWLRQHPI